MENKILTQWAYLRNVWFLQTKGETNLWLVNCYYLLPFYTFSCELDKIDKIIQECIIENTKHIIQREKDCSVYMNSTSIVLERERDFWDNEIKRMQKSPEHIDLIIDVLCKASQDNNFKEDKNVKLYLPLFLYSYDKDIDWKLVLPHTQEVHKAITLIDPQLVYQVVNFANLFNVDNLKTLS